MNPPQPLPIVVTPTAPGPESALAALLQFEAGIRRQASEAELGYFVANESRAILGHDQLLVFGRKMVGDELKVVCVSSLASTDRQAPVIQAIESRVAALLMQTSVGATQPISLAGHGPDDPLTSYPFGHGIWAPLRDATGHCFGGLLTAHAAPPPPETALRLARVAETTAHAWRALSGNRPTRRIRKPTRAEKRGLWLLAAVIALFPVRISVLAPFEVVPERPFVIAAPYDGVIDRIHAAPNAAVRQGQLIITLEDMQVRGQLAEAEERLRVAAARIERASSAAFADNEEAASLGTLRAEQEVAAAELAQLQEAAQRTQITAPRAGMLLYSDRRDWEGRAVRVGEPIVQLADPAAVVVRVDLPTREQIDLRPDAPARLWLDAEPLWARDARVLSASFQARMTADEILSFAVIVRPAGEPLRIGSRGTAKLYGGWAPLIYAVLRRPIAALRQTIGL